MLHRTIITIGRQNGSGGREIGKLLAKELGVAYFDKELLVLAAKESGFDPEIFETNDEVPTSSLLYSMSMGGHALGQLTAGVGLSLPQQLFLAIYNTIRKVGKQQDCVIVGRCADYALHDQPDCLNIFVHAPLEARIRRVMERKGNLTSAQAKEIIIKTDKKRAAYYNSYSDKKWGALDTYHMTVDSEVLGTKKTAQLIGDFVKGRD